MKSRYLCQRVNFFRSTGLLNTSHFQRAAASWTQVLGVSEAPCCAKEIQRVFYEKVERISTSSLSDTAASQQYNVLRSAYDVANALLKQKRSPSSLENDINYLFELHTVHVNKMDRNHHAIYFYNYHYEDQEKKGLAICEAIEELCFDLKLNCTSKFKIEVSGNLYELTEKIKECADVKRCNLSEAYTF